MSCFIVNKRHIDALVTSARAIKMRDSYIRFYGFDPIARPDEFGQILWDANVEAYNERYKENIKKEEYHFEKFSRRLEPIEVIKACNCLEYQCCDWSFWDESIARMITESIINITIQHMPGYESAQWEIVD